MVYQTSWNIRMQMLSREPGAPMTRLRLVSGVWTRYLIYLTFAFIGSSLCLLTGLKESSAARDPFFQGSLSRCSTIWTHTHRPSCTGRTHHGCTGYNPRNQAPRIASLCVVTFTPRYEVGGDLHLRALLQPMTSVLCLLRVIFNRFISSNC